MSGWCMKCVALGGEEEKEDGWVEEGELVEMAKYG